MDGDKTPHPIIREIHKKVNEMHPVVMLELPRMQVLLERVSNAQTVMSDAATRMALTHEQAERRFNRLEDRLHSAHEKMSGKGLMPITSHLITVVSLVLIAVLVVLYINKQNLSASMTSVTVEHTEKK